MRTFMLAWRSLALIGHVIIGVFICSAIELARLSHPARRPPGWRGRAVRWWFAQICPILGLRVSVAGAPEPGVLLISNHVSWMDIMVLGAQGETNFLAKAEVASWPVAGWLSAVAGTLFIARGGNQVPELAQEIGRRVRGGQRVLIFPEGTTSDGTSVKRFHPRLFAIAQQDGIRIQPVAIAYGAPGAPDRIAPFVGDDTLVAHIVRVLSQPGIDVRVRFLPVQDTAGLDRRRLSERCREAIAGELAVPGVSVGVSRARSPSVSDVDLAPEVSLGDPG